MKKNGLFVAIFCLLNVFAFSAVNKDIQIYKLKNDIPVYVKSDANSQMTAVYAVVKGGVTCINPSLSGLEELVFEMLTKGSQNYSYEDIKSFSYRTHSGVYSSSINEGSIYGMSCLNKYFDETFEVFADGFFNPLFAPREFELLMQQNRQNIQAQMNDPESLLFYYLDLMVYENHPYAAKVSPTPESISNLTLDAVKTYYYSMLDSKRFSIVCSGNVDTEKLLVLLNKSFGNIPSGSVDFPETNILPVKIAGDPVVLVHEDASGAAFVLRAFASPSIKDDDYLAAKITSEIFSDIMSNVVREKNGICYTPMSGVVSSVAPFGFEFLYRVTDLKNFISAMNDSRVIIESGNTIKAIDTEGNYILEPISDRLQGYINSYITAKYSSQTTVNGIANRMAGSLLQFGDVSYSDMLTEKVKLITVQDVKRVFKKYWIDESSRWFAVVGPADEEKITF